MLALVVILLGGVFVLLYKLCSGLRNFEQYAKQLIAEKLKSKWDVIEEMPVVEARKWDYRLQVQLRDWMEAFGTIIASKVGEMLGGKKRGGYREGLD